MIKHLFFSIVSQLLTEEVSFFSTTMKISLSLNVSSLTTSCEILSKLETTYTGEYSEGTKAERVDGPERNRMVPHNSAGLVIHNNMALQPTTADNVDCTSFDQELIWLLVLEHLRYCKGDS